MKAPQADVLIVEDDEPTQMFLHAICKRLGFTAVAANDGEAAKTHLDGSTEWKIVLLDLYLPKCNGFEVIDFTNERAPHLLPRTIVVTAASETDVKRARDLGLVHAVLRKPIDINELSAKMKACSSAKVPRRKQTATH
jgi:DNA-binding response OmpR family regulator